MRVDYYSHLLLPHLIFDLRVVKVPQETENGSDMVRYVLVAVVRMRRDPGGKDFIRTYCSTGEATILTATLKYMDNSWSVSDCGGYHYNLIYGWKLTGHVIVDCPEKPRAALADPKDRGKDKGANPSLNDTGKYTPRLLLILKESPAVNINLQETRSRATWCERGSGRPRSVA
jgi:hypothetical protein